MIIGKSTHPVLVKRIEIRVWSLRDEIEKVVDEVTQTKAENTEEELKKIERFYEQNHMDEATSSDDEEEIVKRKIPEDKLSQGFTFLSEISMQEVLFFSKDKFLYGSTIVISLEIPTPFLLTAEVIKCIDIGRGSKIISETKPRYRIQAKFIYKMKAERENLRNFLKSIEPDLPPPPKKAQEEVPANTDNSELDDLGL